MNEKVKKDIENLYTTNEYGYVYQNVKATLQPETVEHYKKEYGIKTNVHKMCVNCQVRQIEKYKNAPDGGEFKPKCSFVPKGLPAGAAKTIRDVAVKSEIPYERAKKLVLSTVDPVAWAELMFGFDDKSDTWSIRSYQKEQIRCSAQRLVVREGRRSGKTFAMALKLVYYAFNLAINKGYDSSGKEIVEGPEIMVVTPYQAQLTNIFNEIEGLVKRNRELAMQVTTGTADSLYVKTPMFKMEMKNGASIRGFVSGLGVKGDGSGGGTIRGQSADVIYLDEMDMIPEDILDKVITPILLTKPGVMLTATSTPIGKRGKFYHWCLEREDFKEDYYPSSVLPHWDEIKNELLRENTKEGFRAEYMAEFIEGTFGVFRPSWIANAKRDYSYEDTKNYSLLSRFGVQQRGDLIICMGIDWNKNAGTEFYVIGYSPSAGKWIGLDAINVSATEYSAKRWADEVIRLNYKWKPNYIYADEGYGHTIIEDLKLYSQKMSMKQNKTELEKETANLSSRLVSFNFSKKVELMDPINGQKVSKSGKHYLVENAVRIMEDGLFLFPADDQALAKQMMNFIVAKRQQSTNKPVYGMENKNIGDHRLDAFMLALGGLNLETSIYSNRSNLDISLPGFIGRSTDSEDYLSPADEANMIVNGIRKSRMPRAFNVLRIMRGSGSDEHDRQVKEHYYETGVWENSEESKRRTSFINEEKSSIIESVLSKSNKTSYKRNPRRNRNKRSWK